MVVKSPLKADLLARLIRCRRSVSWGTIGAVWDPP